MNGLVSFVLYPFVTVAGWLCNRIFRMAFGLTSLQVYSRIMYLPGIGWNAISWRWRKHRWYDRIDNTVVLGALPLRSQTEELVYKENVRAVISLNEDFELRWFTPSTVEWQKLGVDRYQFSVVDRAPPSFAVIDEALQVINKYQSRKESVYVHCKSGKGRSVTIVACHLIKEHKWDPQRTIEEIKRKRVQVRPNKSQWKTINSYYNQTK